MALVPMYQPISDLPMVNNSAVTTEPTPTSRHMSLRSGRTL